MLVPVISLGIFIGIIVIVLVASPFFGPENH